MTGFIAISNMLLQAVLLQVDSKLSNDDEWSNVAWRPKQMVRQP